MRMLNLDLNPHPNPILLVGSVAAAVIVDLSGKAINEFIALKADEQTAVIVTGLIKGATLLFALGYAYYGFRTRRQEFKNAVKQGKKLDEKDKE